MPGDSARHSLPTAASRNRRQPRLDRQLCRRIAKTVPQGLREVRVIEDADPVGKQKPRHPLIVTNCRQRPGDDHSVIAGQDTSNPVVVALGQRLAHDIPRRVTVSCGMFKLIGSGWSGLGILDPAPRHRRCQVTPGRPPLDREAPECQTSATSSVDGATLPHVESAHAWLGGQELDHPAPHLGKAGGNAAHGVPDGGGESRRFCH
jgi:hypothetical protein